MDSAISKSRLPADAVLYRSCGPETADALLKEGEYLYKNFSSTTTDFKVSMKFGENSVNGYRNILVMKRKKGSEGFYIAPNEHEIVLQRNTNYRLVQVREIDEFVYTDGTRDNAERR